MQVLSNILLIYKIIEDPAIIKLNKYKNEN
jgi:hypothetical protein